MGYPYIQYLQIITTVSSARYRSSVIQKKANLESLQASPRAPRVVRVVVGHPLSACVVTVVRTGRHLPDGDISVSYRSVDSTAVSTGSIEWTLAVLNTPTIDETAGVTVSQGGVDKGTHKTTLSGDASNVIITTASDVTVLANADVTIGTTVLVLANINTATASSAVSIGTLDYTPVTGNLQFATGELTKSFTVSILQDEYYEYPDELFQMELYDIKYQAVPSLSYKTWTMTLNSVGITEGITLSDIVSVEATV